MNAADNNARDAQDRSADHELGMMGEIAESFRGRARWLTIVAWAETMAFLGLTIFAVVRFFDATTLREHVGWATAIAIAYASMVAVKIWYHNRLNRDAILREVKRLEQQVAELRREMTR